MTVDVLTAAREYISRGWIIHPLSSPKDLGSSPGKRPLLKAWQRIEKVTDADGERWFSDTDASFRDCNIGLVCGKSSGVTVFDFDSELFTDELFCGVEIDSTLRSGRTSGRGHIYFLYNPDLKAQKHHALDIEILSDGSNAVLPPSIHKSGEVYRWANSAALPMEMPARLIQNITELFNREKKLNTLISQCRRCFTNYWQDEKRVVHGPTARLFLGAFCSELHNKGADLDLIKLFAKIIYRKDYDETKTATEFRGWTQHNLKPWTCKKLKEQCIGFVDCERCKTQKKPAYEVPHETVDPTPITVQEVVAEFKKSYYIENDINITIPLAHVISNFSETEPDIFGIIAPSGSNKTELIRALGETENQYIYPISSLTAHTFVSGLPENQDLTPMLRGRLITIKDFTSILAKKADEVSLIFGDFRDITDGYIKKDFGSGVKKQYKDIHSSILFACTNAIERHYSLYSIMGQRIVFFRPDGDPKKARQQAIRNAGREKEIRPRMHNVVNRLIKTVLIDKKERLKALSQGVPDDMKERIGELCDFLAVVRTHINRDVKGDMAALPEPEYPTRLIKTLCKIVDAHALLYDRLPAEIDEHIAIRLVRDNIPTERLRVLRVLALDGKDMTTSAVGVMARTPTSMTNRILNDLKALVLVDHLSREETGGREDKWMLTSEESCRKALNIILSVDEWELENTKNKVSTTSPDTEQLRGEIREGDNVSPFLKSNIILSNNINNNTTKEREQEGGKQEHPNIANSHPSINQDASPQPSTSKIDLLSFEKAGREWEHIKGCPINNSNLIDFCLWYCEQKDEDKKPSEIRAVAEHVFKITPPVACDSITIRTLIDVPKFVGLDGKIYHLQKGALVRLPKVNADSLIKRGAAEHIKLQTDSDVLTIIKNLYQPFMEGAKAGKLQPEYALEAFKGGRVKEALREHLLHLYPELAHAKERVDMGIDNFAAELIG